MRLDAPSAGRFKYLFPYGTRLVRSWRRIVETISLAGGRILFPQEDVAMYSVIRENFYDLKKLSNAEKQMQEFHSIHAAQRGYRGNIVVDLGAGRMLVVTLWESESLAHAARAALEPAIQRLLVPLMTKPSHLLGAGPVAVADLPK